MLSNELVEVVAKARKVMLDAGTDPTTRRASRNFVDRGVKLQLRLMTLEHDAEMCAASSESNGPEGDGPQ